MTDKRMISDDYREGVGHVEQSQKSRETLPEATISTSMSRPLWWQCHWSVHIPPHGRPRPNGHTRSNHKRDAIYILHFVLLTPTTVVLLSCCSFCHTTVFPASTSFSLPNNLIITERLQQNEKQSLQQPFCVLTAFGFLRSSFKVTCPRQKVSGAQISGLGLWVYTSH